MQHSDIPSINPLFRLQFEKAQQCYVLLFPEGMVKLNGSAGEIMAQVDGKRKVAEIIEVLEQKFPDAGELSSDIIEFLLTALDKKWIHNE